MPGLSLRQRSKLKATVPPPKEKSILFILWKDAHANGVKGFVELHVSDLLLTLKSARVKDLFPVINKKINEQYHADSYRREVERFLLYGTSVNRDRRLDPLIPDLSLTPRFVAVMRAFPKRMPRTSISVSIKTLTNTNLVLHCESFDTVGNVKAKIEKELKISQQAQRLIYGGKQLEDHLALSTYGITDMSQIHLVRMMNGGGASRVFADISDNSLLKETQLYYGGVGWQSVQKGLNIEGKCLNPQCSAFRDKVICPKGFHEFNLMRDDDTKCPMCRSMVIPRTCGFKKGSG
ncbi:hypothetical protein DVH05_005068 [Phytophthora capsici]|nr:hypothetical protein DVH05_005068 [Phytophthora capsici]